MNIFQIWSEKMLFRKQAQISCLKLGLEWKDIETLYTILI